MTDRTAAAATMLTVQVPEPGAAFEIVQRAIPIPGPGQVRLRVQACGVCHSDSLTKDGALPGIRYPRVPGHEVVGLIDRLGPGISEWQEGQRVGVGWHGGHDGTCRECQRGDFRHCRNRQVPGISYDGGYGEYMVAPQEALVPIPGTLDAAEAAPLLCAGITTFDALRRSGACAGDLVAVLGVGGLGHLAIQFAARLGYQVVAIGRGAEPAARARKLGAGLYLDGTATDAEATLQRMGGARVVLATAPDARAMSALVGGLQPNGRLVVIGVTSEPLTVAPSQLIPGSCAIQGYVSGTPADSADTLRFAQQHGVRPLIETYPLEQAPEAYARMLSGKAEFRVVLTTGSEEPRNLAP